MLPRITPKANKTLHTNEDQPLPRLPLVGELCVGAACGGPNAELQATV